VYRHGLREQQQPQPCLEGIAPTGDMRIMWGRIREVIRHLRQDRKQNPMRQPEKALLINP